MSIISTGTNAYSSAYYSLNPNAAATTDSATSSASSSSSTSSTTGTSSAAYLLDLSAEAQAIMFGNGSDTDSSGASSGDGSTTALTLTDSQKAKLAEILAKYKDAPYDQATFDEIQDDLEAANLSPDQVSTQNTLDNFNPTMTFLDALNGQDVYSAGQNASSSSSADDDAKTNYMTSIIDQWQSLSSTYAASAAASTSLSA